MKYTSKTWMKMG